MLAMLFTGVSVAFRWSSVFYLFLTKVQFTVFVRVAV